MIVTEPVVASAAITICVPERVKAGEPFQVTVKVGEIPHVMEEGHHIQWIELYSGANFLARVDLTPMMTRAEVTFTVAMGPVHGKRTLRAIERCNLHGQWEAEAGVEVSS